MSPLRMSRSHLNLHMPLKQNKLVFSDSLPGSCLITICFTKVAQQTALRAAFLVDQAIQEKQASCYNLGFDSVLTDSQ